MGLKRTLRSDALYQLSVEPTTTQISASGNNGFEKNLKVRRSLSVVSKADYYTNISVRTLVSCQLKVSPVVNSLIYILGIKSIILIFC